MTWNPTLETNDDRGSENRRWASCCGTLLAGVLCAVAVIDGDGRAVAQVSTGAVVATRIVGQAGTEIDRREGDGGRRSPAQPRKERQRKGNPVGEAARPDASVAPGEEGGDTAQNEASGAVEFPEATEATAEGANDAAADAEAKTSEANADIGAEEEPQVEPGALEAIDTKAQEEVPASLSKGWVDPLWYDAEADEFRHLPIQRPSTAFWDWLRNLQFPSFPSFSISGIGDLLRWLPWIGVAVLLGVLCWMLVRAYRQLGQTAAVGRRRRTVTQQAADALAQHLPLDFDPAEEDLLGRARAAYREGDYSTAIVFLFSHQLVELDHHRWIRLTRGKTNRQYLGELRAETGLQALLRRTMVAFEDAFFGRQDLERGRFESCWSALPEFDRLVRREVA